MQKLQRAEAAETEIVAYFTTLVAQRRAHLRGDLLSDLIAVEEAGETLSEAEVIAVASLLFGAGFETTTNLIGNGMGALLTNPSECRRLWAAPIRPGRRARRSSGRSLRGAQLLSHLTTGL